MCVLAHCPPLRSFEGKSQVGCCNSPMLPPEPVYCLFRFLPAIVQKMCSRFALCVEVKHHLMIHRVFKKPPVLSGYCCMDIPIFGFWRVISIVLKIEPVTQHHFHSGVGLPVFAAQLTSLLISSLEALSLSRTIVRICPRQMAFLSLSLSQPCS